MPQLTILGLPVDLPPAYASGHVCTQAEADALTALRTRGLAKGLHRVVLNECVSRGYSDVWGFVRGTLDGPTLSEISAVASAFCASYVEGFVQGHERLRAIAGEARRIAQLMIEEQLYAQGRSLHDVPKGELDANVARYAASANVRAEAARRIDDVQRLARSAHDDLLARNTDGDARSTEDDSDG
jgi:hypothetical protein